MSKDWLDVARTVATMSSERKRHGCIVVKRNRVVGWGYNVFRNNPDNVSPEHIKLHCSYHAEIRALTMAGRHAKGATLFVVRINSQGLDRNSRPCDNCYKAIKVAGIKTVVHSI